TRSQFMNQAGLRKLPADLRLLTVCVATALQILWLLPRAEAQASWSTGQYLYAGGGRPTSGTLALELGPRPGNYSVWGSETDVRLNVFLPDQARNYPMQAVTVDGQHTVIAGQEAEMDAVALTPDTILVDFKARGEL